MKVDFVIPWVDDRDKNWIIEKIDIVENRMDRLTLLMHAIEIGIY